jgi:hypothetical protein
MNKFFMIALAFVVLFPYSNHAFSYDLSFPKNSITISCIEDLLHPDDQCTDANCRAEFYKLVINKKKTLRSFFPVHYNNNINKTKKACVDSASFLGNSIEESKLLKHFQSYVTSN